MQHQNIYQITRAKLATELLSAAPNQRRGTPSLRKLVLWSNLLGNQNSNETSHSNQTSALDKPNLINNLEHQEYNHHHQRQSDAEFDWFENLMEEIDDSDSESDSSDYTPELRPITQHQHTSYSTGTLADLVLGSSEENVQITRPSRKLKRAWSSDNDQTKEKAPRCRQLNGLGRRTRRRLLSISNCSGSNLQPTTRKQLGKHHSKRTSPLHPTPPTSIPYWGWITPPHLSMNKLTQIINHPSNSFVSYGDEDDQNSLPGLLSTKSSYLFKSIDSIDNVSKLVQHHAYGIEQDSISTPSRCLEEPGLNSIDFSLYDFLISTTAPPRHDQDHSILQVKYLIGNLEKFRRKNSSHTAAKTDEEKNIHIRIGKQQRRHHYHSSSHGLIVKKFHVFNHLLDFNNSNFELHHLPHLYYSHFLLHSFDHYLLPLYRPKNSSFAWKVYGLPRR